MHTICGGKVQYPHYDYNPHYIWEREMQYLHKQFKHAHYIWVAKSNIGIMTLNPHYLLEAKMQNPYIKHGTFLVEFDDYIKTI
jgi:hypothetical protein